MRQELGERAGQGEGKENKRGSVPGVVIAVPNLQCWSISATLLPSEGELELADGDGDREGRRGEERRLRKGMLSMRQRHTRCERIIKRKRMKYFGNGAFVLFPVISPLRPSNSLAFCHKRLPEHALTREKREENNENIE